MARSNVVTGIDEVLMFTMLSGGSLEEKLSFTITTQAIRQDIIKRRIDLCDEIKWGLDKASSIRLYEGTHGIELGRYPEFDKFKADYITEQKILENTLREDGFVYHNSFNECWDNSQKIAEKSVQMVLHTKPHIVEIHIHHVYDILEFLQLHIHLTNTNRFMQVKQMKSMEIKLQVRLENTLLILRQNNTLESYNLHLR